MSCSLHASYGTALDYNKVDDEKAKAIRAKQFKAANEQKQLELMKGRLEMRKMIGTTYVREVTLRPAISAREALSRPSALCRPRVS